MVSRLEIWESSIKGLVRRRLSIETRNLKRLQVYVLIGKEGCACAPYLLTKIPMNV